MEVPPRKVWKFTEIAAAEENALSPPIKEVTLWFSVYIRFPYTVKAKEDAPTGGVTVRDVVETVVDYYNNHWLGQYCYDNSIWLSARTKPATHKWGFNIFSLPDTDCPRGVILRVHREKL